METTRKQLPDNVNGWCLRCQEEEEDHHKKCSRKTRQAGDQKSILPTTKMYHTVHRSDKQGKMKRD